MAVHKAIEVLYQNQMQFNLGVPLAASNIASRYHKPGPIMVERVGGRNAIPGKPQQPAPKNTAASASSSFNYTMLSEDTMEKVSQLARRDLKNRRLQMEREREKSPSAESLAGHHRRQQPKVCTRQRRPAVNKPRTSLRAREADKNRRIGNVQTPPPSRHPRPSYSNSQIADDSVSHFNYGGAEDNGQTDNFFPVKPLGKPSVSAGGPKDEIGKLQLELESYLQSLCRIEQQVLRNGNADFLQNKTKGKGKNNNFLAEEEDLDRVRVRAGEHNTRSARNLYNLCQKVKQLQRDVSQSDLSKPTKKSQIMAQLNATYRGAVRALQVFVNQLPYQDLQMGLPSMYNELALLIRQLTTLMTLTQHGSKVEADGDSDNTVLTLLDQVDDFNSKWCSMALQWNRAGQPLHRKAAVSVNQSAAGPKAWVSDTKVDPDLLSKNVTEFTAKRPPTAVTKKVLGVNHPVQKQQQQQSQQRMKERTPGFGGPKAGKENRISFASEGTKLGMNKASLAGQKTFGFVSVESKPAPSSKSVIRDIDSTKGYMLPPELMAKRERAQRAVELSNKNFAESTHSSRSRTVASGQRPHSAPSPGRKKEVNFDLREDKLSHQPWIPAGCAPCKPTRARSSSAERIPFFVKTLEGHNMWNESPQRHARSVMMQDRPREAAYGYLSLPTEGQLRSYDVSDSLVNLIERRVMLRMSHGRQDVGGMRQSRNDQMLYSSNEALDITDLTVDKSYNDDTSLNTTAEAAGMVDAPTLENIRLKLADMERTRREIRQRWSSLKFVDTHTRSKHVNECPEPPSAIDYSISKADENKRHHLNEEYDEPLNKGWFEEPLLFTKPMYTSKRGKAVTTKSTRHSSSVRFPPKVRSQVKLNATTLDRILEDRERFEEHLRKRSHHPTGKFDPWTLMEEISEEILKECLQEVSEEVEKVSEEIANQMYKSEFMVTGRPSEADLLNQQEHPVVMESKDQHGTPVEMVQDGGGAAMGLSDQEIYGRLGGFGGDDGDELIFEDYGVGREFGIDDEETPRSRSPGSSGNGGFEPLSHGVPSEPLLDNVSQLVQEKVEGLVEYSGGEEDGEGRRDGKDEDDDDKGDDEYEDDDEEEEDEDDDDDEGDYSDDEFENVSDVEL